MITRISAHARFAAFTFLVLLSLQAFSQDSIKAKADTLILNGFELDREDFEQIHILKANGGLSYFMQLQPGLRTVVNPETEIVNGSTWSDNAYYIEGLPVHSLFRSIGSVYSPFISERMIDRMSFQTMNYSPEKSGISSASDISLFYGNPDSIQFSWFQSLLISDINVNGPVGNKTSFNADFRFLPLGVLFSLIPSGSEPPILSQTMYSYDINFALERRMNTNNTLKLFFGNNPYGESFRYSGSFLGYKTINRFYGMRWEHKLSEVSYSELLIGKSRYMPVTVVSTSNEELTEKDVLFIDDYIADIKLRTDKYRHNRLSLGIRMDINHVLDKTTTFNQGREDSVYTFQDQRFMDVFFYGGDQFNWRKFSANLGIRAGLYKYEAYKDFYIKPQLNLALHLTDWLSAVGDISYNNANIQFVKNPTEGSFYSYSDQLTQKSSRKYQLGLMSKMFSNKVTAECLVFYSEIDQDREKALYIISSDTSVTANLSDYSRAEFYGLNTRLRVHTEKFTGWISASYVEHVRQQDGVNYDEPYSPYDFSKGIVSGYSNYSFNDKYSLGVSATYYTGNEYSFTEYYQDGGAIGMRAQTPSFLKGGVHFSYLRKKEKSIQNFYLALGPVISFRYSLRI